MIRKIRNRHIVYLALILLTPYNVSALRISEVVSNPSGAGTDTDWIEVYNDQNDDFIIESSTRFFIERIGTNHRISSWRGGDTISQGEVFIIANNPQHFIDEYSSYNGKVFDSSINLSQRNGDTIYIKEGVGRGDQGTRITQRVSFGESDDGVAFHIDEDGVIKVGNPTPGDLDFSPSISQNDEKSSSSSGSTSGSSSSTSSSGGSGSSGNANNGDSRTSPVYKSGEIVSTTDYAIAGVEKEFYVQTINTEGNKMPLRRYMWNLGDGSMDDGSRIKHFYPEPGEYVVTAIRGNGSRELIFNKNIDVLSPDIELFVKTGGVEIKNNHNFLIDISGWRLSNMGKTFTFPELSFLSAGGTIFISDSKIGFPLRNELILLSTKNKIVSQLHNLKPMARIVNTPIITKSTPIKREIIKEKDDNEDEISVFKDNFASPQDRAIDLSQQETGRGLSFWTFVLLGLVFISILPVFMRKYALLNKKKSEKEKNNNEIKKLGDSIFLDD